jgi:hypothetical protein
MRPQHDDAATTTVALSALAAVNPTERLLKLLPSPMSSSSTPMTDALLK